jgi:TRAP-type mannitol/chloroaromatic compound transport system substrate-binding protein
LKIRTIPTKVFVSAINAMGANATPMNFGEIYTSLQGGVLDGLESIFGDLSNGNTFDSFGGFLGTAIKTVNTYKNFSNLTK